MSTTTINPWRVITWSDVHGRTVRAIGCHEDELADVLNLPFPDGAAARDPVTEYTGVQRVAWYGRRFPRGRRNWYANERRAVGGRWYVLDAHDAISQVTAAREVAQIEAERFHQWVRSRAVLFDSSDGRRGQCGPFPGAEAWSWNGTWKTLLDAVERCAEELTCMELRLSGGYDGADSLDAFAYSNYEPWISDWSVVVWRR